MKSQTSKAEPCSRSHRRVQVREDGLRSGLHLEMFTSTEGGKGGRESGSWEGLTESQRELCQVTVFMYCKKNISLVSPAL